MTAITIGFALWTVAETVRMGYFVAGLDPLPSWADVFWILGYVFLIVALVANAKSIHLRFDRVMRAVWAPLSLMGTLVVLWIYVLPLVAGDLALDTLVCVPYPLLDVLLGIPTLAILLKFSSGEIGLPWAVLTFGFMLTAAGDLWYAYADYSGTYGEAYNAVDLFLLLGYVAFLFGGLLFRRLYQTQSVTE